MSFILFLIIGLIASWLAGPLMKGGCYGLEGDLVLGSYVGGLLFTLLGLSAGGLIGNIVHATGGAVFCIFIARSFKRG